MASPNPGRRIDRRFLVVTLLLLAVGWAVFGRLPSSGAERSASGDLLVGTPGHSDATVPSSTTPFELGAPRNPSSATTLVLPGDTRDTGDPIATTSIPPTTEPEGPPVVLPNRSAVTDICGFEENLAPFLNLSDLSPEKTEPLVNDLVALVGRYAEVGPADLRGTLLAIQQNIESVRAVLAANGWDPKSAVYLRKVADISASVGDPAALPALLDRAVDRERSVCG